jgi:hypothetical protein
MRLSTPAHYRGRSLVFARYDLPPWHLLMPSTLLPYPQVAPSRFACSCVGNSRFCAAQRDFYSGFSIPAYPSGTLQPSGDSPSVGLPAIAIKSTPKGWRLAWTWGWLAACDSSFDHTVRRPVRLGASGRTSKSCQPDTVRPSIGIMQLAPYARVRRAPVFGASGGLGWLIARLGNRFGNETLRNCPFWRRTQLHGLLAHNQEAPERLKARRRSIDGLRSRFGGPMRPLILKN